MKTAGNAPEERRRASIRWIGLGLTLGVGVGVFAGLVLQDVALGIMIGAFAAVVILLLLALIRPARTPVEPDEDTPTIWMGVGIAIGAAAGAPLAFALGNVVWLAIGMAMGTAIGAALQESKRSGRL